MQPRIAFYIALMGLLPLPTLAASITIQPGDTLSEIALRHSVSVEKLVSTNGLVDSDSLVAGRTLILPEDSRSNTSDQEINYKVKQGDTLSAIAVYYDINTKDISNINNLQNSNDIYIGQNLKIPASANRKINHSVLYGETISSISRDYDINIFELVKLNNLNNQNYLYPGQKLMIPTKNNNYINGDDSKETATYTHIIKKGENLSIIARKYDISVSKILETNKLANPNDIKIGTKLSITTKRLRAAEATPIAQNNTHTKEIEYKKINEEPSWRRYGPININWSKWQTINGSHVAPTLNKKGKPLYLAINCHVGKINSTGSNGNWNNWISPKSDFEKKLLNDRCRKPLFRL